MTDIFYNFQLLSLQVVTCRLLDEVCECRLFEEPEHKTVDSEGGSVELFPHLASFLSLSFGATVAYKSKIKRSRISKRTSGPVNQRVFDFMSELQKYFNFYFLSF